MSIAFKLFGIRCRTAHGNVSNLGFLMPHWSGTVKRDVEFSTGLSGNREGLIVIKQNGCHEMDFTSMLKYPLFAIRHPNAKYFTSTFDFLLCPSVDYDDLFYLDYTVQCTLSRDEHSQEKEILYVIVSRSKPFIGCLCFLCTNFNWTARISKDPPKLSRKMLCMHT